MKRLKNLILVILLLTIASVSPLWSGTTGKIAGTITDKSSGEPLPGANIIVVGTTLGTTSDLNGQYTILDVPPGNYSMQISYIGYKKVIVDDVVVAIDQTTRINLSLEEESIQVGEVVITAERNYIRPDVNTSVVSISEEDIQKLPIINIVSAIGLQAGIRGGWNSFLNYATQPTYASNYNRGTVSVQGGLSIRGGGGENILFQVDGVTLRDPRNNEPLTQVPLTSVKDISVERSGFNAEYGQVRSGVINVVTQEGNRQGYSGSFQIRVLPPQRKYWYGDGIYDIQDKNSFVLRPFFDPAVAFTGTESGGWDNFTKSQYPTFVGWNEVSRILNSDNNPNNDLTPLAAQRVFEYETRKKQINNEPDYNIDAGFGGPVPFISDELGNLRFYASLRANHEVLVFPMTRPDYDDYNIGLKVNSDISSSMRLQISGYLGKQFTMRNNWDATGNYFYVRSPRDIASIVSPIDATSGLNGLFSDFNFSLSDIGNKSLAGKLTHNINSSTYYQVSLEYVRRDYYTRAPESIRDTSQLFEVVPGFYEDSNPFGYFPGDDPYGIIIIGGQHVAKARDFSVLSSTTAKFDFTSQLNFQNLFKAGVEFVYNDLDFDYGTIQSGGQNINPDLDKYQNHVQLRTFPVRGAIYVQDKLELQEFTLNAGLRLDYSNSDIDWYNLNPFDKTFFSSSYDPTADFAKSESKGQWQLSPRLGVAHPITENSKLYFNYGHFRQLPQYESLFRIERDVSTSVTSFSNPNLVLAKTISYELGYDHILFDNYLLQIAAYYNDVTDQQDFTSYISKAGGFSYTYSTANNYEDTRGFELTLRKTGGDWWSGFANYTYQVTTTGHFGSFRQYDDKTEQKKFDEETVNLYQNRQVPQPYARVNLNVYSPADFGPTILNHHIFGQLGANFVFDWQAGYWTTWNPGGLRAVAYNVKSVDYFNTYLRVDKTINIGQFSLQFFVDINNLLDTRRLWNTGEVNYLSSLHFPESDDYTNIPGDDKVGDYRDPTVEFQPMINGSRDPNGPGAGNEVAWYYEEGTYYEWSDGAWAEVDQARVNKALDEKAYIDMPNANTFWFLDPRYIYFGLRFEFKIGQ